MSITVYTKHHCPQCRMTKRMLNNMHVDFDEINLDDHPEAIDEVKQLGYKAAPVVVTETESWSGFEINKLRQLQMETSVIAND